MTLKTLNLYDVVLNINIYGMTHFYLNRKTICKGNYKCFYEIPMNFRELETSSWALLKSEKIKIFGPANFCKLIFMFKATFYPLS